MAKKLNNLNISIFSILKASEKSGIPILMLSNPGVGKTSTVYMFAKVRGYEVVLLRGNSTSAEEIMGYDVSPQDVVWDKPMAACHLRPSWFQRLLQNKEVGKKTLLFLDELTTANEFVQAALLHLIFERKCGEEKLPDDTLIVSCGNYISNLSIGGSFNLLPPIMNRFLLFNIIPGVNDLDIFLNKYEGALMNEDGIPSDYMKELEETLRVMDNQEEKEIDDVRRNKIGEHIERSIREVTRLLMSGGEKPLDMTVTNLQDIYVTDDNDPYVYGFVTFRTLNYLRDVTIAYYLCFGKAGIASDNFRNVINGLCGLGLRRAKEKEGDEVIKTKIGKEYFDAINVAVNDIEKMKNNRLPEFESFYKDVLKNNKTLETPQLQAIINKTNELYEDKDLQAIERPIDPDIVIGLGKAVVDAATPLLKIKGNSVKNVSDVYTTESLVGLLTEWNTIADCITTLGKVVFDDTKKYDINVTEAINANISDLTKVGLKVKTIRSFFIKDKSEAEIKLIPVNKDIKKVYAQEV